jgi:hypothetical protein
MRARSRITAVTVLALSVAATGADAATIADWTFETSQPASTGAFAANTSFGPFAAEVGTGSALGHHTGASTYSSPAGNGSSHSFSSNTWSAGDYYQFSVSTTGLKDIALSWDQTSSSTGPKDFALLYSTNGTTFTSFASYSVLSNGGSPNSPWSASTVNPVYSFADDLSSIVGLNNQATLFFRLVDQDAVAAGGGTVGTAGTDRVDNVKITANAVPLPAAVWLFGSGLMGLSGIRRRRIGL